jgi:MinD-like ATPase involved in chromosome partitioning or flagellar assembly
MSENNTVGKIVTFYSYKGGTGRSMALANVAWILASNGKRVLTVDWDLEAPGLHRYFKPFLVDKDLTSSDGIIDLRDEE